MTFEQAAEHIEQLGLRYKLEERAAILEYNGGLDWGRPRGRQKEMTFLQKKSIDH